MPTYITLFHFTQQGIATIKEGPARLDAAKKAFRSMGAEMKQWYLTTGQYDGIVIAEAPSDETMVRIALSIGSLGNVRTETLRAFTEDEYRAMVAKLP